MPPTGSLRDAQEQNTCSAGQITAHDAAAGKTPWNDSPSPRLPQATTSYPRHELTLETTDDVDTVPDECTARVAKVQRAARCKTTSRKDSALPKSTVCIVIANNEGMTTADTPWSPRGAHQGPILRLRIA